jgi:hypothetical protein
LSHGTLRFGFVLIERVSGCVEESRLLFKFGFETHDGGLGVGELGTKLLERYFKIPIFLFVFVCLEMKLVRVE